MQGKAPFNSIKANMDNNIQQNIQNLISERSRQDMVEQVAEATLAVSEIDGIDSRKAYLEIQSRIQKDRKFRLLINGLSRAAAILFIPLLVASAILYFRQPDLNNQQKYAMQEITTPLGVRSQITLPDGSNVWLNAESTIRFKVPFDQTSREVSLIGEAFFDVQRNEKVPFLVKSGSVGIKVLGTKFNCKAYEEEYNLEVVLAEGKVSLNTNGGETAETLIMKPGDRVVFDKISNQTTKTNGKVDKYIDWHNGKLVFDETPMPEVATQLGRWFGVEILINDPQIENYKLTTTFENESLHQILELIKLSSPVEVTYISATINSVNKKQTKAKVIFTKKLRN